MAQDIDRSTLSKTIYAEARGESPEGQAWVGWVIKNRAAQNKAHWGGNAIARVCRYPYQFECWNGVEDIAINEPNVYQNICRLADQIFNAPASADPTGGADHYNNPDIEGYPAWTENCDRLRKIGAHQFYKTRQ